MDRAQLIDEIAQALVQSGFNYEGAVAERFAEVALAIALPEGPYGFCSTRDCRNPATLNSGVQSCAICGESNRFGVMAALANTEIARYGEVMSEGWMDRIEAKIRSKIAAGVESPM